MATNYYCFTKSYITYCWSFYDLEQKIISLRIYKKQDSATLLYPEYLSIYGLPLGNLSSIHNLDRNSFLCRENFSISFRDSFSYIFFNVFLFLYTTRYDTSVVERKFFFYHLCVYDKTGGKKCGNEG